MTQPLAILAAGGTGGHVFPAEALADALLQRGYRLGLITDARGHAYGGTLGSVTTYGIRAGGIAGRGLVSKILSMAELGLGTVQALALLRRLRPQVVVGFGGYPSFPTVLAAAILGIPTVLHEQNAVLGRANRLLARWATRIATSYAQVSMVPPQARNRVVLTGMPVRPAIAAAAGTDYVAPTADGPIKLLVLGGSQGARILSQVIPAALAHLPADLQARIHISQQCRPEDLDAVRQAYEGTPIKTTLANFFSDIPERMAETHLVITRSGASTVAELTALGRPALLVPYQFATDDHQTANAVALQLAGGAAIMPQNNFTEVHFQGVLTALLAAPEQLAIMAAHSKAFGTIDAAQKLADLVTSDLTKAPS